MAPIKTKRTGLDFWNDNLSCDDGRRVSGYVLPYGQMSYWGAQVIISLFGAIPYIGESLEVWVRGDYYISGSTVSRFFALHVVALPLMLIALVFMHLVALHEVGAGNPRRHRY